MRPLVFLAALAALDSGHFAARERASDFLASHRGEALPYLVWAERNSPSAEVRARAAELTQPHYDRLAETFDPAAVVDPLPWVDSMPPDMPGRGYYISRSVALQPPDDPSDTTYPRYRNATRHAVRMLLRERVPVEDVIKLLREMDVNTKGQRWWTSP